VSGWPTTAEMNRREEADPDPAQQRRLVVALSRGSGSRPRRPASSGYEWSEQLRKLGRIVLSVGVDLDGDGRKSCSAGVLQARLHGRRRSRG